MTNILRRLYVVTLAPFFIFFICVCCLCWPILCVPVWVIKGYWYDPTDITVSVGGFLFDWTGY